MKKLLFILSLFLAIGCSELREGSVYNYVGGVIVDNEITTDPPRFFLSIRHLNRKNAYVITKVKVPRLEYKTFEVGDTIK